MPWTEGRCCPSLPHMAGWIALPVGSTLARPSPPENTPPPTLFICPCQHKTRLSPLPAPLPAADPGPCQPECASHPGDTPLAPLPTTSPLQPSRPESRAREGQMSGHCLAPLGWSGYPPTPLGGMPTWTGISPVKIRGDKSTQDLALATQPAELCRQKP